MAISESLLPEFDHEAENTRKILERVPDQKFDYKPHPKSGAMGWLAAHLAEIHNWGATLLKTDSFDVAPQNGPTYQPAKITSQAELLSAFDKYSGELRRAIADTSDAKWVAPWTLLRAGAPMFTMPTIAVMRGSVFNHIIHHRAQLGLYLRLNDVPVPGLYGPSADEPRT